MTGSSFTLQKRLLITFGLIVAPSLLAGWWQVRHNDQIRVELSAAEQSAAKLESADRTKLVAELEAVIESSDDARRIALGTSLFTALLAIGAGLLLARSVRGSVGELDKTLQAATGGDLTQRARILTGDELGTMAGGLNQLLDKLQGSLKEVAGASRELTDAATELDGAAKQISTGAQTQASSLEQTAASLEQITSTVKQNADNAAQASQLAATARDVADKGGQVVQTAVNAMSEINRSSKKIADIITTIDEIAFQTNLLALNAAVEAARAGEQGRGFAVVAAEVRNLAQRSATAAKEIKGLIEDSVRKVEGGTELVNRSGQTLSEIVGSVRHVTDIISEIASASREQASGIEQLNRAVTQMDSVTQSNAAQTEELTATAQSLSTRAQQLVDLVARFRIGESPVAKRPGTIAAPTATSAPRPAVTAVAANARPAIAKGTTAPRPAAVATEGHDDNDWEKGFEEF